MPRKPSNKPKPSAKGEQLRLAYTATQIRLMQRDLAPVDFNFDLGTFQGIKAYNEHLAHLVLQRKLDGRDHGSLQNGIGNAIRALQGPQQVNVTVQPQPQTFNIDAVLTWARTQSLEVQSAVAEGLRNGRILGRETVPGEVHGEPRIPEQQSPQAIIRSPTEPEH